jgi:hypothetical protein
MPIKISKLNDKQISMINLAVFHLFVKANIFVTSQPFMSLPFITQLSLVQKNLQINVLSKSFIDEARLKMKQ